MADSVRGSEDADPASGMVLDPADDAALEELRAEFEANREPSRADAMAAYMRGMFEFYGLPAPVRRSFAKPFVDRFRVRPEADQLLVTARLFAMVEREYHYVATDLLRAGWRQLTPGALPQLRSLVTTKSWWDSVDPLAHVVGVLVLNHRELSVEMDEWVRDENRWIARVALLHQLGWKDAAEPDRLFSYSRLHAGSEDFFVQKAIGWALRDLARSHEDEVRSFLDEHGSQLPEMSVREASKHL